MKELAPGNRAGDDVDLMLPAGRLFHWAYVVEDLDSAMDRLGAILGVDWAERAHRKMRTRDPERGEVENDFWISYSTTGPPHVELIEGRPGTLFDTAPGPRLHHVGLWAADLAEESQRLVDLGLPVVGHGVDAEGVLTRFAYHQNDFGPWIELVAPTTRAPWERWMNGEPLEVPD